MCLDLDTTDSLALNRQVIEAILCDHLVIGHGAPVGRARQQEPGNGQRSNDVLMEIPVMRRPKTRHFGHASYQRGCSRATAALDLGEQAAAATDDHWYRVDRQHECEMVSPMTDAEPTPDDGHRTRRDHRQRRRSRPLGDYAELMTIAEAAVYLRVATSTTYVLANLHLEGTSQDCMPAIRVGSCIRIIRDRLADNLEPFILGR